MCGRNADCCFTICCLSLALSLTKGQGLSLAQRLRQLDLSDEELVSFVSCPQMMIGPNSKKQCLKRPSTCRLLRLASLIFAVDLGVSHGLFEALQPFHNTKVTRKGTMTVQFVHSLDSYRRRSMKTALLIDAALESSDAL